MHPVLSTRLRSGASWDLAHSQPGGLVEGSRWSFLLFRGMTTGANSRTEQCIPEMLEPSPLKSAACKEVWHPIRDAAGQRRQRPAATTNAPFNLSGVCYEWKVFNESNPE